MPAETTGRPWFRESTTAPEELLARMSPAQLREQYRALQRITSALLAHLELPELLRELLRRLREIQRVESAAVLLCAEDGGSLVLHASQGLVPDGATDVDVPVGRGIVGTVATRKRAVIVDDVSRAEVVSPSVRRLASMMVAPLVAEGQVIGVLHVGSLRPRRFSDADLHLLQVAADRVALAIRNSLLVSRRREAEERLLRWEEAERFLARTSIALASAAPDFGETLRRLAERALPSLGDWCSVFLRHEDGELERLVVTAADPASEPIAQAIARIPADPAHPHPAIALIEKGEPVLVRDVPEDLFETAPLGEELRRTLRDIGIRSVIVVPLVARGRVLGGIVLVATARRYEESDLVLAEEFARRAALAVDNARLLRDAQAASRAKSEFMAVMSHELRTPLNAIVGYADLLTMGVGAGTPGIAGEYAERIGVSARHLAALIEELLAFSRLEAGRDSVAHFPFRLAEIVEEIGAIAEPLARERGLSFAISQPGGPTRVVGDPAKLRQIVFNLVSNAVKFTREGSVELEMGVEGDEVVVHVRDTGIGIPPHHHEKVFEPFWQVEQGTTRRVGGTGLGLSVTRHLVELLGGTLQLHSVPGEGSTFTVRIPARPGRTDPAAPLRMGE